MPPKKYFVTSLLSKNGEWGTILLDQLRNNKPLFLYGWSKYTCSNQETNT